MKVIICGAGKVGTSIAKHLVSQQNDVTVIDQSTDLIKDINEKVDLKTVIGSASNPSILTSIKLMPDSIIFVTTLGNNVVPFVVIFTVGTYFLAIFDNSNISLFIKGSASPPQCIHSKPFNSGINFLNFSRSPFLSK